ncbi:MAG TPA: SIS domain-containing protein [Solirubrobacteraceae bacterium]|nr:SIS domain-containing protein [Solirubrobacteraceae bacterium]
MRATPVDAPVPARLRALLDARTDAARRFFGAEAERLASLCHRMAERFARGGRLLAVGGSPAAQSDVRHVAVEFVHPVIVGKRALPALAVGPPAGEVVLLAGADDIVIGFGCGRGGAGEVARALREARAAGCLTVAFAAGTGAEWEFEPPAEDPFVRQELVETLYHVLWELVHVFFEHRGLLEGRVAGPRHDVGASSFLYPFLAERERDLDGVLADVRASILMKSDEICELRAQTLTDNAAELEAAAQILRGAFERGRMLLALGNGGSATDAMDLVADLRHPPGGGPRRAALDLSADPAIITAISNDIGTEAIFLRQVIAYGRAGDVLVALSTSGNSANVIAALEHARRGGLATIAFVGYDGGRVLEERLADQVIVTRSQHIPRIQEAQATAYHSLCELVRGTSGP